MEYANVQDTRKTARISEPFYSSLLHCRSHIRLRNVKDTLLYLLSATLIPELSSNIAASPACYMQERLVSTSTIRALPDKFAVRVGHYLNLAIKTALLAKIALCVKLGVHDPVANELHDALYCGQVVLKVGDFYIGDSSSGAELLKL